MSASRSFYTHPIVVLRRRVKADLARQEAKARSRPAVELSYAPLTFRSLLRGLLGGSLPPKSFMCLLRVGGAPVNPC